MEVHPIVLEGRFVRLEPLSEGHVAGLTAAGQDEGIWRWLPYGDLRTEEAMRGWVREVLARKAKGTDLPFAVIHLATARVAGSTRYLDIQPSHRAVEVGGTWYGAPWQRTQVNTECKLLLLAHAFETLGCVRVQFKTDVRNERSQRALERIGAVREGVLRDHMVLPDGGLRSSAYYSVLAAEWPAVKARLNERLRR